MLGCLLSGRYVQAGKKQLNLTVSHLDQRKPPPSFNVQRGETPPKNRFCPPQSAR